jgi:hypothetical protein
VKRALTTDEKELWRNVHIPNRVRAATALLPMQNSLLQNVATTTFQRATRQQRINCRCITDSIWEGRQAATRWLLDLLAVNQDNTGNPCRPRKYDDDVDLTDLGGTIFDLAHPDAKKLCALWKGCSQASSHPTHESNHPPIDEKHLVETLNIVIKHLQDTLYGPASEIIVDYVLQEPPS